jgi:hypothetical protein
MLGYEAFSEITLRYCKTHKGSITKEPERLLSLVIKAYNSLPIVANASTRIAFDALVAKKDRIDGLRTS